MSLPEQVIRSRPITVIDPGTQVIDRDGNETSGSATWNRQVLVADVKIDSGDVQALSETILDAATKCSLTLMASVERSKHPNASGQDVYKLAEIGARYSAIGSSGRIIISPDTASDLGIELGFISRQVLRANEKQLANVRVVAKTDQLAIFDAPSVMFRNGKHRKYRTRHFVLLDAMSGEGTMLVWLLVPPSEEKETMVIINHPIRVTKWGTTETRRIHVDEEEFGMFGVPGELAFALQDLPPGIDVNWTKQAAKFAGRKSFTRDQVGHLFDAMRGAMLMGK